MQIMPSTASILQMPLPTFDQFSTVLENTYCVSSQLFISKDTILSQERTTQGNMLTMPMYALATRPLIEFWETATPPNKCGMLMMSVCPGALLWLQCQPQKTWLVVKSDFKDHASNIFHDWNINITMSDNQCWALPLDDLKLCHQQSELDRQGRVSLSIRRKPTSCCLCCSDYGKEVVLNCKWSWCEMKPGSSPTITDSLK